MKEKVLYIFCEVVTDIAKYRPQVEKNLLRNILRFLCPSAFITSSAKPINISKYRLLSSLSCYYLQRQRPPSPMRRWCGNKEGLPEFR